MVTSFSGRKVLLRAVPSDEETFRRGAEAAANAQSAREQMAGERQQNPDATSGHINNMSARTAVHRAQ